ncbi:MAG: dihydrofolate reductase [Candidatus Levybacteria bacterium]|nr:dihydrofolate reductase [Candidatus Levybacteria bacterium]
MKVIMVAVSSLNGKITKGKNPNIYSWTSKEDSKFFFSLIEQHTLIVMGSKTYESARKFIKHKKNKLRIVLTKNPGKYLKETVGGMLEFSSETPPELIKRLENGGYKKMLLVGGAAINSLFLKHNLVHELYLTLEPKVFGTGKNLIADENLDLSFKLISVKKLNKQGTLQLKYKIN